MYINNVFRVRKKLNWGVISLGYSAPGANSIVGNYHPAVCHGAKYTQV